MRGPSAAADGPHCVRCRTFPKGPVGGGCDRPAVRQRLCTAVPDVTVGAAFLVSDGAGCCGSGGSSSCGRCVVRSEDRPVVYLQAGEHRCRALRRGGLLDVGRCRAVPGIAVGGDAPGCGWAVTTDKAAAVPERLLRPVSAVLACFCCPVPFLLSCLAFALLFRFRRPVSVLSHPVPSRSAADLVCVLQRSAEAALSAAAGF